MKKFFALLVMGLCLTTAAWAGGNSEFLAPDRVDKWDLGLGVAGGMNDNGADDAVFVSTALAYGVTPYIGLGVEAGWQEADMDENNGTVGAVPVLFDIILRVPTVHESLVPYGVLGLGGAGVYVEQDNLDDVDDTAFAWKLGAGLDYFINQNWIFNFEFAFWNASTDLPNTPFGDDFEWWTIGIGLKYIF